jgi:hypothetical protein
MASNAEFLPAVQQAILSAMARNAFCPVLVQWLAKRGGLGKPLKSTTSPLYYSPRPYIVEGASRD